MSTPSNTGGPSTPLAVHALLSKPDSVPQKKFTMVNSKSPVVSSTFKRVISTKPRAFPHVPNTTQRTSFFKINSQSAPSSAVPSPQSKAAFSFKSTDRKSAQPSTQPSSPTMTKSVNPTSKQSNLHKVTSRDSPTVAFSHAYRQSSPATLNKYEITSLNGSRQSPLPASVLKSPTSRKPKAQFSFKKVNTSGNSTKPESPNTMILKLPYTKPNGNKTENTTSTTFKQYSHEKAKNKVEKAASGKAGAQTALERSEKTKGKEDAVSSQSSHHITSVDSAVPQKTTSSLGASSSGDDDSSDVELLTGRDRSNQISAREKRRLEYDAARDQNIPPSATVEKKDTTEKTGKKKRLNRELESLTEWADWIQMTLDKKSEMEKEQAKQLEIKLTPPRKKQRKVSNNGTRGAVISSSSSTTAPSSRDGTSFATVPSSRDGPSNASSIKLKLSQALSDSVNVVQDKNSQVSQYRPILPRPGTQPIQSRQAYPMNSSDETVSRQTIVSRSSKSKSSFTRASNSESSLTPEEITARDGLRSRAAYTAPQRLSETPSPTPRSSSKSDTLSDQTAERLFVEPSASEPIMSVTGLPLGAPPSAKIKKESLWPTKKPVKRKNNRSRRRGDSAEPESDHTETSPEVEINFEQLETELNKQLVTQINEKLQRQSQIRSSITSGRLIAESSVAGDEEQLQDVQLTPTKKQKTNQNKEEKRKIKNSSPKKNRENPFGFNDPLQLVGEKRKTDFADPTKDNDDYCAACGEPGIFLCCESCPKSFHFACCDPPFDDSSLPEDEWFCNECSSKRFPPAPHPRSLFSKLLDQVDRRNPTQFKLPKNIRERFEGVSTGQFGEYENTDYKPYKPSKIKAFQQTAPELHYDKDGNPLICVKCGESGITPNKVIGEVDKPIITCEYCPSSWHLDCLDPPLSTIKQLGKKWKCPNHSDDLYEQRRRLRNPMFVDVDLPCGFRNDGNVEITLESDHEGDTQDAVEAVEVPTPLHNYDTPNGIAAEVSKNQLKQWSNDFVIHRIPERGVLLDFMSKIHDTKEAERNAKIDEYYKIARENRELLTKLATDNRTTNEKQALASLVDMKQDGVRQLVEAAREEMVKEGIDPEPTDAEVESLSKEDIIELLRIKKMLSSKGQWKQKNLPFLVQ